MEKNGYIFFLFFPLWLLGNSTGSAEITLQSSFRDFLNGNKFLLLLKITFQEENIKFYASLFSCAIVNLVFLFWSSTAPAAQFLYCCVSKKKSFDLVCNFCSAVELLEPFWRCNILFK